MCLPRLVAAVLMLFAAALPWPASAFEGPPPKVLADAPSEKGAWRVEVLQAAGRDAQFAKDRGPMTLCTTAAEALSLDRAASTTPRPHCPHTVLEDSGERSVVQFACQGPEARSMKNTITRLAPRVYEITSEMRSNRRAEPGVTRMKLSYAGACSAQGEAQPKSP